jgi:hypothetical protein
MKMYGYFRFSASYHVPISLYLKQIEVEHVFFDTCAEVSRTPPIICLCTRRGSDFRLQAARAFAVPTAPAATAGSSLRPLPP